MVNSRTASLPALREAVREWTEIHLPGREDIAEQAVAIAIASHDAGASMAEACWRAHGYVRCWTRHPANRRPLRLLVATSG